MNLSLENNAEVLNMVLLKDISGGGDLFADILVAITRGEDTSGDVTNTEDQLTTMHISEFHWRALGKDYQLMDQEKREMHITALKQSLIKFVVSNVH